MRRRMKMYTDIRLFFAERAVVEVETPILSLYGSTDVHIDSFETRWSEQTLYLQTSPEFAMKKLLAQGMGDCFQLCKVFRHEAAGKNHRPEFTMLEWYRLGFSLQQLIDEVAELVKRVLEKPQLPVEQLTYQQAFQTVGINPHSDSLATLKQKTEKLSGYLPALADDRDEWLDFILVTQIEQHLGRDKLTFLTHYPATMAALAKKRVNAEGHPVAQRFELYYQGIELANGFDELTDAEEQLARFEADNQTRKALGKKIVSIDKSLIAALESGLPDCAGVAVGIDRLLMLAQGEHSLDSVMLSARDF